MIIIQDKADFDRDVREFKKINAEFQKVCAEFPLHPACIWYSLPDGPIGSLITPKGFTDVVEM